MQPTLPTFASRLAQLSNPQIATTLKQIRHGIERETLRINANGKIAQTPHSPKLGAALTNDWITTDFSEALMEFITPAESCPSKTLTQLHDIHKYVYENIEQERLWPLSMPCFIANQDEIPIAQYGESNVGKMKSLYRIGLKNRYGSMMQAIAGVHFNFSLPDTFWQQWIPHVEDQPFDQDSKSAAYFAMIRNYRRLCWMIPYLFGASPALCSSFIRGKKSSLPFKTLGKGTSYLPYATSLRMSDLGYTNKAQSELYICYNELDKYVASLRKAIGTHSPHFEEFDVSEGPRKQLNSNVLQIENELYSPIRPKQIARSLEKPTDALAERGVEYIEVRALDINPHSSVGFEKEQMYFLDVFLLYCLLMPSEEFDPQKYAETESNLNTVVLRGREPGLTLQKDGQSISMQDWFAQCYADMLPIAELFDEQHGTSCYSDSLALQREKFADSDKTPSGWMLKTMLENNLDNGHLALQLAQQYREKLLSEEYRYFDAAFFQEKAKLSLQQQADIEQSDKVDFDTFLQDYFS